MKVAQRIAAIACTVSLVAAAPAMVSGCSAAAPRIDSIDSAGASFPAPLYERWFSDLAASGGPKVNYQATGSGTGVKLFSSLDVDFAATDKSMSDQQIAKVKRGVRHIPMAGGAVPVVYNKPGCDLTLTQRQTADIFLGKITDWTDLGCSAGPITVAHRSDGSGTTAVFTASLSAFSRQWKDEVGLGKAVSWPVGVGGKGNQGVAGVIKNTPGSIGYVSYGYAKRVGLETAALQNKEGNFVRPSAETSSAALSRIVLDQNFRGIDPNPAGATSFPIVGYTWVLAYQSDNGKKLDTLKQTFNYMLSREAQDISDSLGYVPLPESVRQRALAVVASLKS